jgi:hypothetical protein
MAHVAVPRDPWRTWKLAFFERSREDNMQKTGMNAIVDTGGTNPATNMSFRVSSRWRKIGDKSEMCTGGSLI